MAVVVSPANQAPGGVVMAASADASGQVTVTVQMTDADADALSYSVTTPSKGALIRNPDGSYGYLPNGEARHNAAADNAPASVLSDDFSVTVTDGHGGSFTVPVSVAVSPANAVPTAILQISESTATGKVTGAVTATDDDLDPLSYSASAPSQGTVTVNPDGTFVYTPVGPQHSSTDSFTITVVDGHGGTITVPVTVAAPSPEGPVDPGGGGQGPVVAFSVDITEGPPADAVGVAEPEVAVDVAVAPEVATAPAAAPGGTASGAPNVAASKAKSADTARSAQDDDAPTSAPERSSDANPENAAGAEESRRGARTASLSGQQHAPMTAGKSAGTPFPPSAEDAESSDPYSPTNPAAALGLLSVLLMSIPLAGAASSAASGAGRQKP